MARRHLHELLREEQEPFTLSRFIDERRVQLRRPSSRDSPPSRHRHPHHLQIRRYTPAVTESGAFSPSALLKSPSSSTPFVPLREPLDGKKSPLLHLPLQKSPSPASRLTTALLLEAAMRIQKQQEQQQQSRKKRRKKKKKKKETQSPSKSLGLAFLSSILKRLVVRKRQRGITGDDEVEVPFSGPAKAFLKWEARHGENAGARSMQIAGNQHKEAGLDMRNPHYGSQTHQDERKHGEGDLLQSSICCRCGVPECPREDGGRSPWVSDRGSVPPGTGRVSRPSPSQQPHPGPSPPRDPSPDLQTPAGSPDRRKTEGQLFRGAGDDGRPESSYYDEGKKEQFSPVSVLDPPFDEEDHQRDDDSHHPELEEDGEQAVEEDEAADVDSFQHSLTIVQKAKQQLLSRIRRFERLAELDPVELERRLAEEEDEGDEHGGYGAGPETTLGRLHDSVEMEASAVRELVQTVLGFSGGAGWKIPADARRLVLDLAEEERRDGTEPMAARLMEGVEKSTAEGVRWRFEARRGLESNTIDMMVGMDLRQEGDGWRRFPEQVREAVAAVEAAVFTLLVDELTEEFVHGCSD